jgi:hypothetical protein
MTDIKGRSGVCSVHIEDSTLPFLNVVMTYCCLLKRAKHVYPQEEGTVKRSLQIATLSGLVLAVVFFSVVAWQIATHPGTAAKADTVRAFTFVNNTSQTIWAGALANSGFTTPANGGWEMAPGATYSFTVANNWQGRFWGRTYCSFDSAGKGTCESGDCGGVLQCKGAGGVPPVSLAEFTLTGADGKDFYDVSFVDGFNVPMTITPVGGASPIAGNPYWCGVAGCGTDLNINCPAALRSVDGSGRTVACKSACEAFNTDQYCCRGAYNVSATCIPANWPVNYAAYFKSGCPNAYSYAYDDATSTFTDAGASYRISFGPAGGGTATAPALPTVTPTVSSGITSVPTVPATTDGFIQNVTRTNTTSALFAFKPGNWTAGYVILHYTLVGSTQENVHMKYNTGTARWEYSVGNLPTGAKITYSFTYQKSGLQYDTSSYSWASAL